MTATTAAEFSAKQITMAREYLANGNHEKCIASLHSALHWRNEAKRLQKAESEPCPPTIRTPYR